MTKKLHFLNHTSFLVEHDEYRLLLDPWPSEALSFNSWRAHPPCFLNNDILASFINSSNNKSGIVISHGHDDHCDDRFLKKINSTVPVFFPQYSSKGFFNRVKNCELNNINLLNQSHNISFGPFNISSFIISKHSHDDAVIIISTDEYVLIHANDNSVKFPDELIKIILDTSSKNKKTYFASQTGIAHGFPYCYPQFGSQNDLDSMRDVAIKKIKNTIKVAINNANLVNANYFISYAAYTMSMALLEKHGEKVFSSLFLPTPSNLKKLSLDWGGVSLLDYMPGDTLDIIDNSTSRPFWLKNGFENMSKELQKLQLETTYEHKKKLNFMVRKFDNYTNEDLYNYIKNYLKNLYDFTLKSNNSDTEEVLKSTLELKIENGHSTVLDFKDGSISTSTNFNPNKRIIMSVDNFWLLLSGIFNFESMYIGQYAEFERYPKEVFNKQLIMQLQIFGYVYQKRLVPKELKKIVDTF